MSQQARAVCRRVAKNGFVAYRGLVADGADEPVSEPGQPEGVDEKSQFMK